MTKLIDRKTRRNGRWWGVLTIVIILMFAALPTLANRLLSASEDDSPLLGKTYDDEKVHIGQSGEFQIRTSSDWLFDPGLDTDAEISISNRFADKYLSVFSDPKAYLGEHSTLETYLKHAEKSFESGLRSSPIYQPHIVWINGHKAYQFAVKQEVEGTEVAYIVTTVETTAHYHWITAWTAADQYGEVERELHAVICTFDSFSI